LDAARNQSYKDYLYPQMVNLLDKLKKLYDWPIIKNSIQ
jgi:hypothetical protein